MRALPLLLLAGCAEPPDPFTRATLACEEGEEACARVLSAHLGLDSGLSLADEEALLLGGELLLSWDLGPWPPRTSDYVRAPFADWLSHVRGERTNARVYNAIARSIEETRSEPHGRWVFISPDDGVVTFLDGAPSYMEPENLGITLAHEAAHRYWPGHATCTDPVDGHEYDCDRSWGGAYGMGVSVGWLAWQHHCNEDQETSEACYFLEWQVEHEARTYIQPE